jgi:uncharacterized protein
MGDGPVVSNTTPLISLVGIGQLELLYLLYGEIWIPDIVLAEYRAGAGTTDPQLEKLPWLKVHPIVIDPMLHSLLDAGDAAALTLAIAVQARVVILDEAHARHVAQQRGLPLIGSIGVLLRAKQRGLIPVVTPLIDQMIAHGQYISPSLRDQVIHAAGEA